MAGHCSHRCVHEVFADPELGIIRGLRGGVATRRVPRTDFSLADIQQLAAALGDCVQLKKLTWACTSSTYMWLAWSLCTRTVPVLTFCRAPADNKFDKAAAAALAPELAKLSQLQSLDLTCECARFIACAPHSYHVDRVRRDRPMLMLAPHDAALQAPSSPQKCWRPWHQPSQSWGR